MAAEITAFEGPALPTPDKGDSPSTTTLPILSMDVEEGASPPRTRLRLVAILFALYLSIFIAAIDETIVATANPTISAALHSNAGYFWIGGAYLLANAAASPVWSKCSDIWGRKPLFLMSVALFAGASILAALSANIRMLIIGRSLQGTAAGGLLQLVPITLADLFSQRERALHFGIIEVVWAISGGLGPIVGGVCAQLIGWRWCFWINLPICGTTFVLIFFFLNVHSPHTKFREGIMAVDWFGTLSILGVTLMLLLGFDFGGATFPWSSPTVICLLVFGTVMIVFFVFSEKRLAKYPLMPLELFKSASNNAVLVVCFTQGMAFIASQYYLPLYFQSVKLATPVRSGVLILPATISTAVAGFFAGLIVHRTGRYREVQWAGTFLLTLGVGLFIAFNKNTSIPVIAVFAVVEGIGAGLLFSPPIIAIQATVKQDDVATATATLGFVRNIATAISIIVGGVVFQNGTTHRIPQLGAAGLNATLIADLSGSHAAANIDIIRTISNSTQQAAVQESFAWSLRNMWIMYTVVAAIGFFASLFIVHSDLSSEHTETRTGVKRPEKAQT